MTESILTKYRPKTFKEVVGQDRVVKSLLKAVEGRSPTYLFTGPSGTGKTTLARLTAEELGCKPEDLTEIDGATNAGADDMRNIVSDMLYRPLSGGVKAIIIDEVQAISKQAWQVLLKTLEEPPDWVFWFLCTTEPTKVPESIKTRCMAYTLKPVDADILFKLIGDTMEASDVPDEVVDLCAEQANGSPRQALANLGVCLTAADRKEAGELLRTVSDETQAIDLARALIKGANWKELQAVLVKLADVSPESVRHVCRAYMTKVALNAKSEEDAGHLIKILDNFSQPFHPSDGMTPLVLACGKLTLW